MYKIILANAGPNFGLQLSVKRKCSMQMTAISLSKWILPTRFTYL